MKTQIAKHKVLEKLQRNIGEYQPQLEKALAAIQILKSTETDSEEFGDALAQLHVCATILEPYSQGIVEVINNFTEDMYEE
jgi:hypothetical protein